MNPETICVVLGFFQPRFELNFDTFSVRISVFLEKE